MELSRRRFNSVMLAAMGSVLTRRALGQPLSSGTAMGGDSPAILPTVPEPVTAGPLAALERKRLHALDDLHLNNAGGDPQGNLDKITDAMVQLYQQVRAGATQGGEIYFPTGTYAIPRPLRTLPDLAFTGESAEGSVIKNITTGKNTYWTGSTLFAGSCHPSEGWLNKFRFRPFTATPQEGDRHLLVKAEDYDQIAVGDEIKIFGATSAVEDKIQLGTADFNVRRPDRMVKVMVTGKKTSGSDRIFEIDRPMPWTLPSVGDTPWGDLRGVPAWTPLWDWPSEDPDYWMRPGQHGYDTYTRELGPNWGKGWTSRRNLFRNITLWSQNESAMFRGMHCDSVFDHCIMKAAKRCLFGNTFQYSRVDDCTCYFADQLAEIEYCSLFCHLTNITAIHDGTLGPDRTPAMGLFTYGEQGEGFIVDGLTLKARTREMTDRNKAMIINSRNNFFRRLRFELADSTQTILRMHPHNPGLWPPFNVTFRDWQIDMPGAKLASFMTLEEGCHNIAFQGLRVNAAGGAVFCNMQDPDCHDVTFSDVVAPGKFTMSTAAKNIKAERCNFAGGIDGKYASSLQVTPGAPDPASWS